MNYMNTKSTFSQEFEEQIDLKRLRKSIEAFDCHDCHNSPEDSCTSCSWMYNELIDYLHSKYSDVRSLAREALKTYFDVNGCVHVAEDQEILDSESNTWYCKMCDKQYVPGN